MSIEEVQIRSERLYPAWFPEITPTAVDLSKQEVIM
jgi:hypothetical protein